jgi:hypothetical protein
MAKAFTPDRKRRSKPAFRLYIVWILDRSMTMNDDENKWNFGEKRYGGKI